MSDTSEEYHSCEFSDVESESSLNASLDLPQTSDDTGGNIAYDESLEPVPNEEEAAEYLEQLQEEEEEEQLLLTRFSGEINVIDWCKCSNCSLERIVKYEECWCCRDIVRSVEMMEEVDMADQCITSHPGFADCCLNTWVLQTAGIGFKTRTKKSYTTTKVIKNASDLEFFRSVAYRQYVRLVYKYVGSSRRIPLPNCVYNKIREAFPSDHYLGYEEEDEDVEEY